jgi:hypothetical protein
MVVGGRDERPFLFREAQVLDGLACIADHRLSAPRAYGGILEDDLSVDGALAAGAAAGVSAESRTDAQLLGFG